MQFWVIAAGLMGLSVLAMLAALRHRAIGQDGLTSAGPDSVFYRAQVAEIARLEAAGLLGAPEAEASRIEAARRLLAAERSSAPAPASDRSLRRVTAGLVLLLVPAMTLGFYALLGAPHLPGQPLAARVVPTADDINVLVARIEQHLAANPEDARGHELLIPVYMRLGRHGDAAQSLSRVIAVKGSTAEREADLGEILAVLAQGRIEGEPKAAFERARALDPSSQKARFYLALGARQAGDLVAARAGFASLLAEAPDETLKGELTNQIASLDSTANGASGIPAGTSPVGPAGPSGSASPTGPGSAAGAAIAALPAPQQLDAVRGMVEALADRLATTGGSAAEWARLIRSLGVLGEHDRRAIIAAEARMSFAKDPAAIALIEAAMAGTPGN